MNLGPRTSIERASASKAPDSHARRLCAIALLALGIGSALPAASEPLAEPSVWRWMAPFYMQIPKSWQPQIEGGGVGYYSGRYPDASPDDRPEGMTPEEFLSLDFGMVRVGWEKPPREGQGVEGFLAEIREIGASEKEVRDFSMTEEEVAIGQRPAVLVQAHGEAVTEEGRPPIQINMSMALARDPDGDGRHLMIVIGGSRDFADANREMLKEMMASADESHPAYLALSRRIDYVVEGDAFRFTFGPAVAPDGAIALGDSRHGRIRIYGPDGALMHEWGEYDEKAKATEGTLRDPKALAFAPDGSLLVLDEGPWGSPSIQRFARDGGFIARLSLGKDALGENALLGPAYLAAGTDGTLTVGGVAKSKGESRVLHLSADGALLGYFNVPEPTAMAPLPDGGAILSIDADRADRIQHYDPSGRLVAEWSLFGSRAKGYPGDQQAYFAPNHMATDASGRIFVHDRMGDAIWIYAADGEFLQVVPDGEDMGIFEGLAATPAGDLVIQERPSTGDPRSPTLRYLVNAEPARHENPIAPSTEVSSIRVSGREPTAVLQQLAAEGRLTVRALRAFGTLDETHDRLALQLKGRGLDLLSADESRIREWLADQSSGALTLPAGAADSLRNLADRMSNLSDDRQQESGD